MKILTWIFPDYVDISERKTECKQTMAYLFHFLLFQVVQLAGLDMEHRVTTSMILQPKLGVLLEQLAEVWVQICL